MEQIINKEMVQKKSPIGFYLIIFLVFVSGIVFALKLGQLLINKPKDLKPVVNDSGIPSQNYPYEAKPPSLSQIGNIERLSGVLKKQSRDSEDWLEIASPSSILQGEQYAVEGIGKALAIFPNREIILGKNCEIWFVNTIDNNFLVEQRNGSSTYELEKPLTVKIFDTIVNIDFGIIDFNIDSDLERFTINMSSGSAKLSYLNVDNETQVTNLIKDKKTTYILENHEIISR